MAEETAKASAMQLLGVGIEDLDEIINALARMPDGEEKDTIIKQLYQDYEGQEAIIDDALVMAQEKSKEFSGSPEGREAGGIYVAANPLEHLASALRYGKAERDTTEQMDRREALSGERTAGMDWAVRQLMGQAQDPMNDPNAGPQLPNDMNAPNVGPQLPNDMNAPNVGPQQAMATSLRGGGGQPAPAQQPPPAQMPPTQLQTPANVPQAGMSPAMTQGLSSPAPQEQPSGYEGDMQYFNPQPPETPQTPQTPTAMDAQAQILRRIQEEEEEKLRQKRYASSYGGGL